MNREVQYKESRIFIVWAFKKNELEDMVGYTHSLRIGGATAYTNAPNGVELSAAFMGMWNSKAQYDYMYACEPVTEATGLAIEMNSFSSSRLSDKQ